MRNFVFFIAFFLLSCSNTKDDPDDKAQVNIVCTTGMIGDAVRQICDSNLVEVHTLMGPGTDPHIFKPTKQSLDLLSEADLIVANGLHLEGRMQEVLEKIGRQKKVVFLGEGLETAELIQGGTGTEYPDPHIWFDVSLWANAVRYLKSKLNDEGVIQEKKADEYIQILDSLHLWVSDRISSIPSGQRVLITAHDAFSYFGRAYNIEVVGLQGISTVAEYGIQDVTNMVDLIAEREIKAVFIESSISPRSIEAVIAGARQKGVEVIKGGTLYSDALGPEGSGATTYKEMVEHNVETITKALK